MYHKILVANDGSDHAWKALDTAIELAGFYGAELHMICVEEQLPHYAATVGEVLEERAEEDSYFGEVIRLATSRARDKNVVLETFVTPGHAVEAIVKHITRGGFDLLVFGFMGHSRVLGRIMGGTANTLSRVAPCSVLVVR